MNTPEDECPSGNGEPCSRSGFSSSCITRAVDNLDTSWTYMPLTPRLERVVQMRYRHFTVRHSMKKPPGEQPVTYLSCGPQDSRSLTNLVRLNGLVA